MAPFASLTDTFSGPLDPVLWTTTGPPTPMTVGGQLVELGVDPIFVSVQSQALYDLTGSYAFVEVVSVGGVASVDLQVLFSLRIDSSNRLLIYENNNVLICYSITGGVSTQLNTVYNRVAHRFWRFSEAAGLVSFSVSPDAQTWTTLFTAPVTFPVTALRFSMSTNTTAIWDNVNVVPVGVPLVPLVPVRRRAGEFGWRFYAENPAGVVTLFKPLIGASVSSDLTREVRRTVSGVALMPAEAAKVDLAADLCRLVLVADGVEYPMGLFRFVEDSVQEDAVDLGDGTAGDMTHCELGDQFVRLLAADERPIVALAGTDPSQVMIDAISSTGVPHSITGSVAPIRFDVVWSPGTTLEAVVSQCADLAGHRRPWSDNDGVIRSIAARVVDTTVIALADLGPLSGSVVITNTRLSSPNRVVVQDDQAAVPTVGIWDAPASAPNSVVARGWVRVLMVAQQGLSGAVHARDVAETIGEQLGARKLAAQIPPTHLLDGPVVLAHRGALWLMQSWSASTAPNTMMGIDATELTL